MDYKCENQGHSIPKHFTWVKWPIWRTPLAYSNSRHLSIVCVSYWRAEIRHACPSDVHPPSQKKSIPTVWYPPKLKSTSRPFLCRLVSTTELWPLVSNLLTSFLWRERVMMLAGSSPRHWSSSTKAAYRSFSVLHLEMERVYVGVCVWGSIQVSEAQGLWIAILA